MSFVRDWPVGMLSMLSRSRIEFQVHVLWHIPPDSAPDLHDALPI